MNAGANPSRDEQAAVAAPPDGATVAPPPPVFELGTSPHFAAWLAGRRVSLVFTTYQTGKLFLIGHQPNGRLSIFERTLERVMGLHADTSRLYLSTLYQVWRFDNALAQGERFQGYDALYTPRESRFTGELDVHDMAVDGEGRVLFSNTLFNCVATPDDRHSFRPVWTPPWISRLVPEDRCHLNGLALREGRLRYVTAVSRSDVPDGWRDRRRTGGVVADTRRTRWSARGSRCPTRRGGTGNISGSSIPGAGTSAASTWRSGPSSGWCSAPDSRAGSRSTRTSR